MMQERDLVYYNQVKNLYEEAKVIWKGVLFEILLDPIYPEAGLVAERHVLDYRDCLEDFGFNNGDPDRELSIDELLVEIGKLRDYKKILRAVNQSIENLKDLYGDEFTVTLSRVMDYTNQENHPNLIQNLFESDSEMETEDEEVAEPEEERDENWEDEWDDEFDAEFESDSGVDSPPEQHQNLQSSDESEVENTSDSGLQTESDDGAHEWLLNWESD